MQELTSTLEELKTVVPALRLMVKLQVAQFAYYAASSKAPSTSTKSSHFKARLQAFYGNTPAQDQLRCMLLNVKLPMALVAARYLYSLSPVQVLLVSLHTGFAAAGWEPYLYSLLGFSNIHDPRNGLLLFAPLAYAFADSRICFYYVEEAGEPKFRLELLDRSLTDVKLWDYAERRHLRNRHEEQQIDSYAANVTFGELQGKALVFEDASCRPFKRCLRFQATQAVRRAKEQRWLPADWTPSGALSCSPGHAQERLDAWLTFADEASIPDLDSEFE
ncbi:hypothetical protein HXX76_015043 [Chlamydomonas incerta]|uniref:HNH nuclease domain-containing protein n=1 Tax=Chlamydomonas incerta TaxID=51695 RepID=A0A835SFE1_CHLIN|nr:hypothetical protein HXX76_015043 [Chlamydomonas incerta]|eukprot:KAG2423767.1 hypothetical protein HXX76_015043 [Chlamydomonas incerta]